jgi:hypothetical protein
MEEWRKIEGYENYEISSLGNVRRGNKILSPWRSQATGHYYYVKLKRDSISLSRLVALTFIPVIDGKMEIDHINRDVSDNRVENLRWVDNYEQALNRNMPIPPSGHRNVLLTKCNTYEVRVRRRNVIVFQKNFKSLPDAIKARDEFLSGDGK